ncbi:hypothetical protein [Desulfuribacillus alkaliarsenatis]|uniref:Methyl-accepting transducer domain-containing protein n=1 Tax=Desulfuribacillus alkaliarsenatis TaxID=766136 RepID=A0A1E5G0X6_9FIRM|nr:hypothetical protein [Desulfuribacillus alkaliarsenatis]OEF96521.1 hypothetical protein BHF68_07665 [Desulfuribacillus alkaliarsenatis]
MKSVHDQCSDAVQQIEQLIAETQDVYGSIYSKLPMIEEEIDLTTKEVEILLDYFLHSDAPVVNEGREALHLSMVLKNVFDEVAEASAKMSNEDQFRKIMERFLAESSASNISIKGLMDLIPAIKNKIADIELISMNAIIYSAKLGEQGKAFEVISDNIMAISNCVAADYDSIELHAQELQDWNKQFAKSLEEIISYHRRLTTDHLDQFQAIHTKIFQSLKVIRDLLYGIINSIQASVEPVYILMNQIQEQDIIQQSLENVIEIINHITEKQLIENDDTSNSNKQLLNKLSFYQRVLGLSTGLVGNIEERLHKSLVEIKHTVYGAKEQLDDMLEEGSYLVDIISGEREDQKNVIQHIFQDVDSFLGEFNQELLHISFETDTFKNTENSFIKQMRGIENKISGIKKEINQLNKLNLLSRIELARINDRNSNSFVNEITNISQVVIEEVNKNKAFVGLLRIQLEDDLSAFIEALSNNQMQVKLMQETVEAAVSQMDMAKNLVVEAIQPIGMASKGLSEEVAYIIEKLNTGEIMFDWIKRIKEQLHSAEIDVYETLSQELDKLSLTDWNSQSNDFNIILEHLTTHYERTVAKLTLEEDVDVGTEGGELTLF